MAESEAVGVILVHGIGEQRRFRIAVVTTLLAGVIARVSFFARDDDDVRKLGSRAPPAPPEPDDPAFPLPSAEPDEEPPPTLT